MTAVDVDALDKLREAATRGEWRATVERPGGGTVVWVEDRNVTDEINDPDATLIVAMHAALPDLLAAVRERDALRKDLTAIVDEMEDDESIGIPPNVPLLIAALRALAAVDAS